MKDRNNKRSKFAQTCLRCFIVSLCLYSEVSLAFTANKVWFEFRKNGKYRVHVNYTVPALKEFRESYVEFNQKREAEKFYFDLIRGADFHLPSSAQRLFKSQPLRPIPW
ncbi:MAG: hypothetical protein R3B45_03285 [Bdellovibrionota bacterium]